MGKLGGPLVQMVDHHYRSLWSDGILQTRHRISMGGIRNGVRWGGGLSLDHIGLSNI